MVFSTRCAGWSIGKPESRPCAHGLLSGFPILQPAHLVLKTIFSKIRSSAPEDGHNDA